MSSINTNTNYKGLAIGGFIIGSICLAVSMFQATVFFTDNIPDPRMKLIITVGVGAALLTSQWLVRALIPLVRSQRGFLWAVAIAFSFGTIVVIETLSIASSSVTVDGGLKTAIREQNTDSPERKMLKEEYSEFTKSIAKAEAQVDSLNVTLNGADATNMTNRGEVNKQIRQAEYKVKQLREQRDTKRSEMNGVNTSVLDATMSSLEETTGISQSNLGLLFGILMTICALVPNLVMGALTSSSREVKAAARSEVITGKKPQSSLRAVS